MPVPFVFACIVSDGWPCLLRQAAAVAEAEVTALLSIHEIASALEAEKRRMLATIDSQQVTGNPPNALNSKLRMFS